MKLQKAIEVLIKYNKWRRGKISEPLHPHRIGKAIDTVIEHYKETEGTLGN